MPCPLHFRRNHSYAYDFYTYHIFYFWSTADLSCCLRGAPRGYDCRRFELRGKLPGRVMEMIGTAAMSLYDSTIGKKIAMAISGPDPIRVRLRPHGRKLEDLPSGREVINHLFGAELRALGGADSGTRAGAVDRADRLVSGSGHPHRGGVSARPCGQFGTADWPTPSGSRRLRHTHREPCAGAA